MSTNESLKIKTINDRISIAESQSIDENTIWSLVILPENNKLKRLGLLIWILAWTVCGLLIIGSYKLAVQDEEKIFIIVFTFFWLYFEWKMIKVFIWKKWGKEKLWFKAGLFILEENVLSKKNIQSFRPDDINSIELVEFNEKHFFDFLSNSFWNKGKPRIKINALGKNIYFAYQLSDTDALKILKEIKKITSK